MTTAIGVTTASAVRLPIKTAPGGASFASMVSTQYPNDTQSRASMVSVPIAHRQGVALRSNAANGCYRARNQGNNYDDAEQAKKHLTFMQALSYACKWARAA